MRTLCARACTYKPSEYAVIVVQFIDRDDLEVLEKSRQSGSVPRARRDGVLGGPSPGILVGKNRSVYHILHMHT